MPGVNLALADADQAARIVAEFLPAAAGLITAGVIPAAAHRPVTTWPASRSGLRLTSCRAAATGSRPGQPRSRLRPTP